MCPRKTVSIPSFIIVTIAILIIIQSTRIPTPFQLGPTHLFGIPRFHPRLEKHQIPPWQCSPWMSPRVVQPFLSLPSRLLRCWCLALLGAPCLEASIPTPTAVGGLFRLPDKNILKEKLFKVQYKQRRKLGNFIFPRRHTRAKMYYSRMKIFLICQNLWRRKRFAVIIFCFRRLEKLKFPKFPKFPLR